jgi:Ca2+-binding EF-hand superfamily protein
MTSLRPSEVSTSEIAEHASRKLRGVSMETVMRCWHSVGALVKEKYDEGKGAAIDRFGTFTVDANKRPVFSLNADFSSAYRVKQNKKFGIGVVPTTRLNYAKLATVVGVTREVARQVVDEMVLSLGTAIRKRGKVRLGFVPMCELLVDRGVATMRFTGAALQGAVAKARTASDLSAAPEHFVGSNAQAARNGGRGTTLLNQLGQFGKDVAAHDRQRMAMEQQVRREEQEEAHYRRRERRQNDDAHQDEQRRGFRGRRPGTRRGEAGDDGDGGFGDGDGNGCDDRRRNSSPSRITSPTGHGGNPDQQFDGAAWGGGGGNRGGGGGGGGSRTTDGSWEEGNRGRRAAWGEAPPQQQQQQQQQHKKNNNRPKNKKKPPQEEQRPQNHPLVKRVRDLILARGGEQGIHTLQRVMAVMDSSGDKMLSREELHFGLRDYGIVLSRADVHAVFDVFDRDGSGTVDFDEFLFALRGDLSLRRLGLVKQAFKKLDKTRDGVITIDDLRECYDASSHPDVVSRKLTAEEVFHQFLSQWEASGTSDGVVSLDEFVDYYRSVSAAIDRDGDFDAMMNRAWGIGTAGAELGGKGGRAGGGGGNADDEEDGRRRVVVTHSDGRKTVEQLDNAGAVGGMSVRAGADADLRDRMRDRGYDSSVTLGGLGGSARADAQDRADRRAQRAAARRSSSNARGGGGSAAGGSSRAAGPAVRPAHEPLNAWGDYSAPLVMDHMHVLRELLFRPPVTIDQFSQRLGSNRMGTGAESLSLAAFCKRLLLLNSTMRRPVLVGLEKPGRHAMALARYLDAAQTGFVSVSELHAALEERFGRASQLETPVSRLMGRVLNKGGVFGIHALARVMRCVDGGEDGEEGDNDLTKEEFKFGLRDFGVPVSFQVKGGCEGVLRAVCCECCSRALAAPLLVGSLGRSRSRSPSLCPHAAPAAVIGMHTHPLSPPPPPPPPPPRRTWSTSSRSSTRTAAAPSPSASSSTGCAGRSAARGRSS